MKALPLALVALCAATCCSTVSALVIDVSPGSLVDSKPMLASTRDRELKLTGSASASDLATLRSMSRSVETLDLSELGIEGNSLPDLMLAGSAVRNVFLPSGLLSVGRSAFAQSSLSGIVIPESVLAVADYAFASCLNLETVSFAGPSQLGRGVFNGATSLRRVDFNCAITEIPDHTFENCSSYAGAVPVGVTRIGAYAYCGTAVESVDLSSVSEVGDFAFADCKELTEITVGQEHEMAVGKGAFFADSAIEILPDIFGFYPQLVLAGSAGSDQLSVNGSSLEEAALAGNRSVKTLRIGPDVKSIGAHAFRNMSALETVNVTPLAKAVPVTDVFAFSGLENSEGRYDILLHVTQGTSDIWKEHPVWGRFNIVDGGADVGSIEESRLDVGVTRDRDVVKVTCGSPVSELFIYAADGKVLWQGSPQTYEVVVNGLPTNEVLIVRILSAEGLKIVKLR